MTTNRSITHSVTTDPRSLPDPPLTGREFAVLAAGILIAAALGASTMLLFLKLLHS